MQPQANDRLAFGDDSALFDPELIKAARHIYRTFYEVHPEVMQRPIGVAIAGSAAGASSYLAISPYCYRKNALYPSAKLSRAWFRPFINWLLSTGFVLALLNGHLSDRN